MEINISAPIYRTEMFLYSKQSYGHQFQKNMVQDLEDSFYQSNRAKTQSQLSDTPRIILIFNNKGRGKSVNLKGFLGEQQKLF